VAIPAWFGRASVTLDSAARLLAEDLREVQNRAAFRRTPIRMRFLPEGDGYEFVDDRDQPVRARTGDGPYMRRYSHDAVFEGVRVESFEVAPDGELHYDGLGFLEHPARIVLGFQANTRTLILEERTGVVTIEGLEEPWMDDGN
jgi:hypothetical protein